MNMSNVQDALLIDVSHLNVSVEQQVILQDVHLQVHKDEIVTLIGPNGAGKSTLVKAVLGLIQPNSGRLYKKAGLSMGYMPQKLLIEPYMPLSVQRFLELAPLKSSLDAIVKEVGIGHLLTSPMQTISGGESQRVLLARALLSHPELLVLDEPAQGVDVVGQQELYQLIMRIRDRWRCSILMVSHDLHMVMAGTDSVICLNKHVCCSGLPGTVSQHPEFLKLFGAEEPAGLAMYKHTHNHRHDLDNAQQIKSSVRNIPLVESPGLLLLPIRTSAAFEPHVHEGHDGHDHHANAAHPDMHFWLDPLNAKILVNHIAKVLSKADSIHAKEYQHNAQITQLALDKLNKNLQNQLKSVQKKPYIVFHDAYQYFEHRYGLEGVGAISLNPEIPPSAKRVKQIQDLIKDTHAVCVFSEPQFQSKIVQTILEGTNAHTGELDPLGQIYTQGIQGYVLLLENLAKAFNTCLKSN